MLVVQGVLTLFEHFKVHFLHLAHRIRIVACAVHALCYHTGQKDFMKVSVPYMPIKHRHTKTKSCNLKSNPISTSLFTQVHARL